MQFHCLAGAWRSHAAERRALDLPVRPRVVWLGQAMLNAICGANHVKPHGPGIGRVPVAWLLTELDAVVRKDRVNLVRHRFQYSL